jgi:hypothetical protein
MQLCVKLFNLEHFMILKNSFVQFNTLNESDQKQINDWQNEL